MILGWNAVVEVAARSDSDLSPLSWPCLSVYNFVNVMFVNGDTENSIHTLLNQLAVCYFIPT